MSNYVCLIPWMYFNSKENGEKKSFSYQIIRKMVEKKPSLSKPRHQYHVSHWEEHDCSTRDKMNGDYYE